MKSFMWIAGLIVVIGVGYVLWNYMTMKEGSSPELQSNQTNQNKPMENINPDMLAKMCAGKGKEFLVTQYSNAEGSIGGYVLTPDTHLIADASPSVYDAAGKFIAFGTLFASEEQRNAFKNTVDAFAKDFPIKKESPCA